MDPTKPKWKTTEFWVQMLAMGATVIGILADKLPPVWGEILLGAQAGIYTWSRLATKRLAAQRDAAVPVAQPQTLTAEPVAPAVGAAVAKAVEPLAKTLLSLLDERRKEALGKHTASATGVNGTLPKPPAPNSP